MADEKNDEALAFVKSVQGDILSVFGESESVGALVLVAWFSPFGNKSIDVMIQHSCSIELAGPELAERARQALVSYQAQEFNGATGLKS